MSLRGTLALLALSALLAGCAQTTVGPPRSEPRHADVDMCRHPWAYVVDEGERAAEDNGTRLVVLVSSAQGARHALANVTYALVDGRDPNDARELQGTLDKLAGAEGDWSLVDADGDGALTRGDRFAGHVPGADVAHAHWHLLLWDEAGTFLGGTPSCM